MSSVRPRLPKVEPTPESAYLNRRQLIKQWGLGTALIGAGAVTGITPAADAQLLDDLFGGNVAKVAKLPGVSREEILKLYPFKRSDKYPLPGGAFLTDKMAAFTYNNFYEFTQDKRRVWKLAKDFDVDPWTVEITGECLKPQKFDIDALHKLDLEERTYRHRCVEAWAMDVPWTGFPLHKLLAKVEPKASAKYVRFFSAVDKKVMVGVTKDPSTRHFPWPFFEGLTMPEAMNELCLGCTGLYGQPLTRQNGAPFRIVTPWKYGYKSPKSIVKIELVEKKPTTLWETLQPTEFPFESNVNPAVPHPRWSQAAERVIPNGALRETLYLNGYAEWVGHLYKKA
ncbi:MAG: protein-methionine-sulfoxide reductase catalytic subunit MsrP [Phycisphaera sp.]|nr:protein-methionine-sulfoxide reductase catalytic subunit MsrP [Phycisphaera sp.]